MLKKVVVVTKGDIWDYTAKDKDYLYVYNNERGELFVDIRRNEERTKDHSGYYHENIAGFKDWESWKALKVEGNFIYEITEE